MKIKLETDKFKLVQELELFMYQSYVNSLLSACSNYIPHFSIIFKGN